MQSRNKIKFVKCDGGRIESGVYDEFIENEFAKHGWPESWKDCSIRALAAAMARVRGIDLPEAYRQAFAEYNKTGDYGAWVWWGPAADGVSGVGLR